MAIAELTSTIPRMTPLYYAAPLFTDAERRWNTANAQGLRAYFPAVTVLVPQEFCTAFDAPVGGKPDFAAIHAACIAHLLQARAVLAVLDGADADSGTSFEIGYAVARGIPVIGLRTDWRPAEDGGGNCMLTRSCRAITSTLAAACAALAPFLGRG